MASVKVAVRVRPFNEREINLDAKCIIKMESNKTIILNTKANDIATPNTPESAQSSTVPNSSPNGLLSTVPNATSNFAAREKFKEFVYDASYWSFDSSDEHFVSQQDVYNDLGRTTVNNAFEGYNACVCAYGQTGSGKSYSMMGNHNNSEQEGLIPRICKALFERVQNNSNQSTGYRTEVSYLEIYNEKVRDLLRSSQKTQQNLKVREHPKTGVYVQDLSEHIVVNYFDIEELINRGNLNRTTASTNMNDTSSRSHAIFTIKFAQAKIVDNIPSETVSKMNLVDLAGSERADSTGATGIRLKEGGNINKSLLTFINVISTLADLSSSTADQKKTYIPYRDSVLTWLLKDSLGGNSKTVILAAISPADVNYMETLSTLRYANRAKNIINKPTINEDPNVKLIRELRAEIVRLKFLLQGSSVDSSLVNQRRFSGDEVELQLKQEIEYNENKVNELSSMWKCKWEKYHQVFEEYENLSVEKSDSNGLFLHTHQQPYLICINETVSSKNKTKYQTGISIYPLKEGKTYIGPRDSFYNGGDYGDESYKVDVYVENGEGEVNKCYITRADDGLVWLSLICGRIQLNSVLLDSNEPVIEMKNGDYVLIGDLNLFKFCNPIECSSASVGGEEAELSNRKMFRDLFRMFLNSQSSHTLPGKNELLAEQTDDQTELANLTSKLSEKEKLIEEQRAQIRQMSEQIEINNAEMKQLKESSIKLQQQQVPSEPGPITSPSYPNPNQPDIQIEQRETMQNLIEKFERDEKLLSECMKELNKTQESQLKSLIFELQRLRLREQELEVEARKSRAEIENSMERLNEKRDLKLSELNKMREQILQNKQMIDLKLNMSQLSHNEMELDEKIAQIKNEVKREIADLDRLNTELNVKKMYSASDSQSLDELAEAEYETIKRSREQLEKVKAQKEKSYEIIETELEQARQQMLAEFEANNPDLIRAKKEIEEIADKETKLKQFLNDCLYENDEEKCLVENELTELVENREVLEEKCEEMRGLNKRLVDEQMKVEYNGLEEIKKQDSEEIKQDEERISVLEEGSIRFLQNSIKAKKSSIGDKQNSLKNFENIAELQAKKMNKLLAELEVLESKRLFEESKIFSKELQVANEIKVEFDKLNAQMGKLDSFYHRKIDENLVKKEGIKPKICALVGSHRGIQLFEADFNPKCPQISSNSELSKSSTSLSSNSNIEDYLSGQKQKQISSLFVDTGFNESRLGLSDSGTNSGMNSSASSNGASPVSDLVRTLRKEQLSPKFQTSLCKYLNLTIEINESMLFGRKSWDEHYEYLIEIRLNDESWFIFRRYSKIRQLHEQMCLLYPSLNRLVFPMRWLFNNSDKHLIERQVQLEHYLRCFFEVLLSDPTSPICLNVNSAQLSGSLSMNSINSSLSNQTSTSSLNINEIHAPLITRAKITSFCSFFEQTANDLSYFGKLNANKSPTFKNMLNHEINA